MPLAPSYLYDLYEGSVLRHMVHNDMMVQPPSTPVEGSYGSYRYDEGALLEG